MKRMVLFAFVGCSSGSVDYPSSTPPPPWGMPISGGTMHVTRDGTHAVIADPDRDRIMIVDLDAGHTTTDLALPAGSEPGRIAEDGAGRLHVALRGAGSLLTLEATGAIRAQRFACGEPRGVAWEATTDLVHVACTGGELVSFAAADGDAVRTVFVDRDLRDVLMQGSQLVVTRFRTAEVIKLDAQGAIVGRITPPIVTRFGSTGGTDSGLGSGSSEPVDANPTVAWRTIALGDGRLLMTHQRKSGVALKVTTGGYGTQCGRGPVESAITVINPDGTVFPVAPYVRGALPIDVAIDPAVTSLAFASAGDHQVTFVPVNALIARDDDKCGDATAGITYDDKLGAPTSVAYRPNRDLVVFYPEYPAIVVRSADPTALPRTIALPGTIGYDSGRALFHSQTTAGIACASCHPEAREDGQTWVFDGLGPRRTQSLAGGILSRGPYHWSGDMTDLGVLMENVFAERMLGGQLTQSQKLSLGPWLDRVAAPQPSTLGDAAAVARGQTLFLSQELGCITCHTGPLYTNNTLVNVGTGGNFKVPSLLGVAARAPYMHDGCASTLRDRFITCGNSELHGNTATLSAQQLDDLIAFLESL